MSKPCWFILEVRAVVLGHAACGGRPPLAARIEVKQPGKAEGCLSQALEYAFHTGVPFGVLTDGRMWSFYLPAKQGKYEDRRAVS